VTADVAREEIVVDYPVRLVDCTLAVGIDLRGARLRSLVL
jgi:hypothetical protein